VIFIFKLYFSNSVTLINAKITSIWYLDKSNDGQWCMARWIFDVGKN